MASNSRGNNLSAKVALIAEEFLERRQAGELPTVESYCRHYPEIATEIREVLEAVLLVEDLKPHSREQISSSESLNSRIDAPSQIGGYRILRELGRGGMGVVYEAEQESLNRRVALKLLAVHSHGNSSAMARFESEARAAARMHHTNIVPVFEVGQDRGYMFYAMQLIHGQGLDKVIDDVRQLRQPPSQSEKPRSAENQSRPTNDQPEEIATLLVNGNFEQENLIDDFLDDQLAGVHNAEQANRHAPVSHHSSIDTQTVEASSSVSAIMPGQTGNHSTSSGRSNYHNSVAEIGQQIARALAYAHGRGVIHRDIKPSNLMLDATGTVWVTDFGLAKTSDEAMTHTGDILGTLRYMSPERFQGECDARADIYSLGLTLYELLVLQPAFLAKDRLQLIELVTKSVPPKPRSLDPKIPRDLETIILKCIDPAPRHRYQTANDLADELGRFVAGEPILARAIGPAERAVRWCHRNPWIAALSATAVMLLVAGTIVSTVLAIKSGANAALAEDRADGLALKEQEAQSLLKQVEIEKQRAENELHQSQRLLNLNRIQSAHRDWTSHHAATAWRHLNAYQGDQFDWEHRYLFNLFRRNQTMLTGHLDDINAFDISADGTLLVSVSGGIWNSSPISDVRIWDAESGQLLKLVDDYEHQVMAVSFNSDGSRFATADRSGALLVRNTKTGDIVHTIIESGDPLNALAYSHDGRKIVTGGLENSVRVWNAETGELVFDLTGHSSQVHEVAFSPDDKHIVSASSDNTLMIWNAETGQEEQTLRGHHASVYCVAYNSTGTQLVSGCWDSSIAVWDATSGRKLLEMHDHTLPVYGVAFSPDDKRIVSGSFDQKIKVWSAESGQELRSLEGHTGTIYDVRFSNDGNRIYSGAADRTIRIWDSGRSDETLTLRNHSHAVTCLAFSPKGEKIVSGGCQLRVCNVETGEEVQVFDGEFSFYGVAWSPDGQTVAASTWDGTLVGWSATGSRIWQRPPHETGLMAIAFSQDSSRIAVGSGDGHVLVVDSATGDEIRRFLHGPGQVKGIAFSPDGSRIYAGSGDGNLAAYDVETGAPVRVFKSGGISVYDIALSDDGTRLASAGPTPTINVWDTDTGEEVMSLTGHIIQVFALDFNPDGKRLIVSGSEHTVELWDLDGRQSTLTLEGHGDAVVEVAFSPTGEYLATGSLDRTLKLWDASENGQAVQTTVLPHDSDGGSGLRWVPASDGPCPPSASSAQHTLVIIENQHSSDVALYWSDGEGNRVDWGRLEPGSHKRLSTYSGHSWVLADEKGTELGHLIAGESTGAAIVSATGVVIESIAAGQPAQTGDSELATLNNNLKREPTNAGMLGRRASWYGARGRWDEASTDMQEAVRLDPLDFYHSCYLSPLLAYQQNESAYAEHCKRMLQTWKPTDDPRNCERVAKACLLLPEVVNPEAVNALVARALTVGEDYTYWQYFLMLKGLNALRNKDFTGAVEACEQSRGREVPAHYGILACTNFAIEAQAHYHIGDSGRAQESLASAKQLFDTILAAPGQVENPAWPDWLIARILYNEAEALINAR